MDPYIAQQASHARLTAQRHLTTQTRALRRELWPEHPDPITLEQRAQFAASIRVAVTALRGIARAAGQIRAPFTVRDLS